MRRKISTPMIAAAATEPMTIPAIAPPERPFLVSEAGTAELDAEDEDEGVDVAEAVGELVLKVMKAVMVGRTTPLHLCSA